MTSEPEDHTRITAETDAPDNAASDATSHTAAAEVTHAPGGEAEITDTAGGAAEVSATAPEATATMAVTAPPESTGTAAETVLPATTALPAATDPTAPAVEARDSTPLPSLPPQDGVRVGDSLEAIKTAVVWLVVIQLLTILSPLLRVSLRWSLIVGLLLTLSSFALGGVAYLKAQRAQRTLPD